MQTEQQNAQAREGATADLVRAFHVAHQHELAGEADQAEALYRGLLQAAPDQPDVLHNLGLLLRSRDPVESEALLRRAVSVAEQEPAFRNSLGALLFDQGRTDEARQQFEDAVSASGDYADARFNLALLQEQAGEPRLALESLNALIAQHPRHTKSLVRISALLNALGDTTQSVQFAVGAAKADPRSFEALYQLAVSLAAAREYDSALRAIAAALELRRDDRSALMVRANILRDAARHDEALEAYGAIVARHPASAEAHVELNRLAWAQGRDDLYLRSFAQARESLGEHPELMTLEAAFHLRREQFGPATHLLQRARELAPSDAGVVGLLARSLAGQGRYEDSYPLFAEAVATQPGNLLHRLEFGMALLKAGLPIEAEQVLEQALALDPDDQLVLATLTQAHRALGKPLREQWVDYARYVRVFDLTPGEAEAAANFHAELAAEIDAQHHGKRAPIDQTIRGGTQTQGALLDEPTPRIAQLRAAFEQAVASYIRELPDDPSHPLCRRKAEAFRFAGSWSCRLQHGGFHRNHVHPRGWISSVYYARLPDGLEKPAEGWLKFGQSMVRAGEGDAPEYLIQPVVGRLVLFPSFYWHGTVPFVEGGDRLTVAFDAVPVAA